ncbi:MAG: hypothetical protein HQ594_05185 [Candidatus Omnitrophica bacterium]|nr:hypothetical protein [Candidatus Omnitrophota bacterium]
MKKGIFVMSLLLLVVVLSGCGETLHGMWKDTTRIGKGVKTVFVSDPGTVGN